VVDSNSQTGCIHLQINELKPCQIADKFIPISILGDVLQFSSLVKGERWFYDNLKRKKRDGVVFKRFSPILLKYASLILKNCQTKPNYFVFIFCDAIGNESRYIPTHYIWPAINPAGGDFKTCDSIHSGENIIHIKNL